MANPDFIELNVRCKNGTYPIYIGNHLLTDRALLIKHIKARQVLMVTNETIAPLYLAPFQAALTDFQCDIVVLPDGESHKNNHSLTMIYDVLISKGHDRDTTLIALGGGVIGDLTGYAAATYQRGVSFIQMPTTLLAQVDASVGGKTAINHPHAKNMIGSFHQPKAVLMDLNALNTLPAREFRAGLAEVIKSALLSGGDFLQQLLVRLDQGIEFEANSNWLEIIADCCRIKALYVEADEKEQGQRALLNLGHTFGHALESATHYNRWLHGEAVAIGLYCAGLLSHKLGYLKKSELELIDAMLEKAKLPRRIPQDIDLNQLRVLMQADKKVKNNALRFILIRAPGDCFIEDGVPEFCLHEVIAEAVEGGQSD